MRNVLVIIGFLLLVLASCRSTQVASVEVKDSTNTTVTERTDSVRTVTKVDSSWLLALLECDSNNNVLLKKVQASYSGDIAKAPVLTIKNNVLQAKCICDSLAIYAKFKAYDTVKEHFVSTTITPEPVQVKYIPGWMWFFGITGMIAWVCGIIYLLVKILVSVFVKRFSIK